ncbi:hypothetical protein Hamer_G022344 [Homarus americanus]|uniref:Uncharacterized protein n=1 Tax=Homarus americanus TaxID=6706 RepID=A0A8J5N6J9_HOMAM|nr:hypothetical protein Hamer_G022344 [Homarus americanus]
MALTSVSVHTCWSLHTCCPFLHSLYIVSPQTEVPPHAVDKDAHTDHYSSPAHNKQLVYGTCPTSTTSLTLLTTRPHPFTTRLGPSTTCLGSALRQILTATPHMRPHPPLPVTPLLPVTPPLPVTPLFPLTPPCPSTLSSAHASDLRLSQTHTNSCGGNPSVL